MLVAVVGYAHHTRVNDPCNSGRLYWIVQNSWGTQLGHNGYVYSKWCYVRSTITTTHLLYSRIRELGEYAIHEGIRRDGMSSLRNAQKPS
jgi:C1A family cysteine protease